MAEEAHSFWDEDIEAVVYCSQCDTSFAKKEFRREVWEGDIDPEILIRCPNCNNLMDFYFAP